MAKHGEYTLFLPLKFEKNKRNSKSMDGELNPGLLGESQICNPLDHGHLFDNNGLAFELLKTKKKSHLQRNH